MGRTKEASQRTDEDCGMDRLVRWITSRPDYLRSEFNDDCGGASFMIANAEFLDESACAMRAAGFEVVATADGWTAAEPIWPFGVRRKGSWRAIRCTPKTNGRNHDTFEIIYQRQSIVP